MFDKKLCKIQTPTSNTKKRQSLLTIKHAGLETANIALMQAEQYDPIKSSHQLQCTSVASPSCMLRPEQICSAQALVKPSPSELHRKTLPRQPGKLVLVTSGTGCQPCKPFLWLREAMPAASSTLPIVRTQSSHLDWSDALPNGSRRHALAGCCSFSPISEVSIVKAAAVFLKVTRLWPITAR